MTTNLRKGDEIDDTTRAFKTNTHKAKKDRENKVTSE